MFSFNCASSTSMSARRTPPITVSPIRTSLRPIVMNRAGSICAEYEAVVMSLRLTPPRSSTRSALSTISRVLFQPKAGYGESRQGDNRLRALEALAHGGDRLFKRRLIRPQRQRTHFSRRNRRRRVVGWNEDIGGLIVSPRLRDHTLHLDCAIVRIDKRGAAGRRG